MNLAAGVEMPCLAAAPTLKTERRARELPVRDRVTGQAMVAVSDAAVG
jgi:hypothetical protein